MRFTAQEEYGLRCILQLARLELAAVAHAAPAPGSGSGPGSPAAPGGEDARSALPSLTAGEIARLEGLTAQYAGKLLSILVKAGLVESVRGRRGGVRLARPAGEIAVSSVLQALGGVLYQEETCDRFTGDRALCVHTSDCAIRSLWSGIQGMIDRVLSRTTLRDLCCGEAAMDERMESHGEGGETFQPIDSPIAGVAALPEAAGARDAGCMSRQTDLTRKR